MSSAASERLPTLRGEPDEELRRITDDVFSTVGRPLKAVSLFYALYWLVEIEGVQEAAFDFKQVRERQSLGFWWYGTFAMASEFANGCERYFIVGEPLSDKAGGEVREHAREFLFPDDPAMAQVASDLLTRVCRLNEFTLQRNLAGYENTYGFLKRRLEAYQDLPPDVGGGSLDAPFVEVARDLFQAMPSTGKSPDLVRTNDETGWSVNFNGPAWVNIGNFLLQRAELSDTAWVDQMWALEHNNRNWFDKIDLGPHVEGPDEAAVRAVGPDVQDIRGGELMAAVQVVLDANREGDMETVFKAATEYDRELEGINLRRLARQTGVLEV